MNSFLTDEFFVFYHALPDAVRQQARQAYALFRENPHHPSLRFRRVHPTRPIFCASRDRLSGGWNPRRQRYLLVLDRIARRIRSPAEATLRSPCKMAQCPRPESHVRRRLRNLREDLCDPFDLPGSHESPDDHRTARVRALGLASEGRTDGKQPPPSAADRGDRRLVPHHERPHGIEGLASASRLATGPARGQDHRNPVAAGGGSPAPVCLASGSPGSEKAARSSHRRK